MLWVYQDKETWDILGVCGDGGEGVDLALSRRWWRQWRWWWCWATFYSLVKSACAEMGDLIRPDTAVEPSVIHMCYSWDDDDRAQ